MFPVFVSMSRTEPVYAPSKYCTAPEMNFSTFICFAVSRWQLPSPHFERSMPLSVRIRSVVSPVITVQPLPESAFAASSRSCSSSDARASGPSLPAVLVTSSGRTTMVLSTASAALLKERTSAVKTRMRILPLEPFPVPRPGRSRKGRLSPTLPHLPYGLKA